MLKYRKYKKTVGPYTGPLTARELPAHLMGFSLSLFLSLPPFFSSTEATLYTYIMPQDTRHFVTRRTNERGSRRRRDL